MMVEIRLIENNDEYIEYSVHDHDMDNRLVSVMRMYKDTLKYTIDGRHIKVRNVYEAHACRIMKKLCKRNTTYPEIFDYGWG